MFYLQQDILYSFLKKMKFQIFLGLAALFFIVKASVLILQWFSKLSQEETFSDKDLQCRIKYKGTRNYYNRTDNLCYPVAKCNENQVWNLHSSIKFFKYYIPADNSCRDNDSKNTIEVDSVLKAWLGYDDIFGGNNSVIIKDVRIK